MKFIKSLLIAVIILIVITVAIGFFLPSRIHVERSIIIDAPKVFIFNRLNGFKSFNQWSPWAKIDPNTQYTFSGPDYGVGARMEWTSNNPNVGNGSQEVLVSEPNKHLEMALDFGPEGQANSSWDLTDEKGMVKATWGLDIDFGHSIIGRYMGLMMDGLIGKDYEKGLKSLKQNIEALPHLDFSTLDAEITQTQSITTLSIRKTSATDDKAIAEELKNAYSELMQFMSDQRITLTGPPMAITHEWNEGKSWVFDAAIPVNPELDEFNHPTIKLLQTYAGKVVKVVQRGPYSKAAETYPLAFSYLASMGLELSGNSWEVYVNDPSQVSENEIQTDIYFPVK
ncbi:MAG: SRPBCC family protein [bacterium]